MAEVWRQGTYVWKVNIFASQLLRSTLAMRVEGKLACQVWLHLNVRLFCSADVAQTGIVKPYIQEVMPQVCHWWVILSVPWILSYGWLFNIKLRYIFHSVQMSKETTASCQILFLGMSQSFPYCAMGVQIDRANVKAGFSNSFIYLLFSWTFLAYET